MPGLRRCPWSVIDDDTWRAMSWFREWKDLGILPWGGSEMLEQPAFVVEAISVCSTEAAAAESDNIQREMRKQNMANSTSAQGIKGATRK